MKKTVYKLLLICKWGGLVSPYTMASLYAMASPYAGASSSAMPQAALNQAGLNQAGLNQPVRTATNELEEVVVLAPKVKGSTAALIEVRRQSSAVTDVLGAEQMSRQGDSDAAASLRRVTGLTLMNGKYVYVRGLGERYSGVQMNGFSLPSPEPARRVVPLDLFPSSTLESVLVQKSYTPDLPGEFGGGMIQLQTRTLPEKFFVKLALSTNLVSADNQLSYRGGSTDWMGRDDGTRRMPSEIRSALRSGKKLVVKQSGSNDGISQDELTKLGQSLPDTYATHRTSQASLPSFTTSVGNRFKLGGTHLGVASSALYGQDAASGRRFGRGLNAIAPGRTAIDYEKTSTYSEIETRLAGHLDLGLEVNKNNTIQFSTFLLRHTTNFAQEETKRDPNSISQLESTILDWTERQLWTRHFKGKHDLTTLFSRAVLLEWRAGWSDATRENPDRREYAFERTPDSYQMRSDSGGNRRTYSELTDRSIEYGVDSTIPLTRDSERYRLKIGANQITRRRQSDVFRLYFLGNPSGAPIETQLNKRNIGPGGFDLRNLTEAADSYTGDQSVFAHYALLDLSPRKDWKFQLGARQERSAQAVNTFRYFEPTNPYSTSQLEMNDLLPAYSVAWTPDEKWRARLTYSETLARPDFRELSEVGFVDDESGYEVRGNSALKGTVIQSFDHRWEYYFTSEDYFSIGAFYKKFNNPIEVMFVPGVNRIQTFANARAANNYGLELESRHGLRQMLRALRRWSVMSNLTLIRSQIELDESTRGVQTSDVRPLQGQSPYVINVQLQYDRPMQNLSATLLYNVIGQRITEVGTNDIPDTYEQPVHQLDFVATKTLAKTWTVGFKVKNLLDPEVQALQGSEVVRLTRNGRTFGLSLSSVF